MCVHCFLVDIAACTHMVVVPVEAMLAGDDAYPPGRGVLTLPSGEEHTGIWAEGKLVDLYANPACTASIVVDLGHDLSEGSHSCGRILRYSIGFGVYRKVRERRIEGLGMVGKIASDQGLANFPALTWIGEEVPKIRAEFRVVEIFAKGFDGGLAGIPLLVEQWSA